MSWQTFLESARESAREIETLTYKIANGGSDWSNGGPMVHSTTISKPTESAALMGLTVVPQLERQRADCEKVVGTALVAIQAVRERLGEKEGDVLEMFYIDGMLSWEIANELRLTVDGVFYRKHKALAWMDRNIQLKE